MRVEFKYDDNRKKWDVRVLGVKDHKSAEDAFAAVYPTMATLKQPKFIQTVDGFDVIGEFDFINGINRP